MGFPSWLDIHPLGNDRFVWNELGQEQVGWWSGHTFSKKYKLIEKRETRKTERAGKLMKMIQ